MGDQDGQVIESRQQTQRIDQWLWYARFAKSRSLAQALIGRGKVRVNRQRIAKSALAVKPGDVVTITLGPRVRVIRVEAIGARRGPATEAALLFTDLTPAPAPIPAGDSPPAVPHFGQREAGAGRPTKKDRRQIDRFKLG